MRILVWHGYLLAGTGSNVYTRALVHEWSRAGHEVVVLSQEPHPEAYDLGGAETVRPDIGGPLPVFVVDRYEALADAEAVFVGSAHIREALEEVVGHVERVHEVPPGVDVEEFRPRPRDEALAGLLEEARRDPPNPRNTRERLPDERNAARLEAFLAGEEPTVVYFGKLLYNKGVHVLLEALRGVDARAVIVGFGDYRRELEAAAPERTLFTGPFEHRHLVHLLPLADVAVVPSIFPEAFGMVAAEAAAAGCPALVARHSGLAEIAEGLEHEYPPEHRDLASFVTGDVDDLRAKLRSILALPEEERRELGGGGR